MTNSKTSRIETLDETIYTDGSGSAGTYRVLGHEFSGITTGIGGRITVTPLRISTGYRGGREKGIVRSASRAVESYLSQYI